MLYKYFLHIYTKNISMDPTEINICIPTFSAMEIDGLHLDHVNKEKELKRKF